MSVYRYLGIAIVACWLAGGWAASAQAQPQAMPATVLATDQPTLATPMTTGRGLAAIDSLNQDVFAMPDPDPEFEAANYVPPPMTVVVPWTWQLLPDGLIYKCYLASEREPRLASQWFHQTDGDWMWDAVLGGRVGLIRYGTPDGLWPEGFEVDVEGAAFPRLDGKRQLVSSDFRVGVPFTFRRGRWEGKFGYLHLSSHLADEYIIDHDIVSRINYVRDSVVLGLAYRPIPAIRLYGEADWAFHTDGGAKPWEFQIGAEWSSAEPTGALGAPFLAVNGEIRQDADFGGNVNAQAGWQWRGVTGRLFRIGADYFNGKSEERQFYRYFERRIGLGLWYDF